MFGINLKHSLAIVVVAVGVLSAAGSASAAGVSDGTSNTIMFGERAAAPRGLEGPAGTA